MQQRWPLPAAIRDFDQKDADSKDLEGAQALTGMFVPRLIPGELLAEDVAVMPPLAATAALVPPPDTACWNISSSFFLRASSSLAVACSGRHMHHIRSRPDNNMYSGLQCWQPKPRI